VLINEIAWMGTAISSNDEWIELYNSTASTIDLTGWKLEAVDGSPQINLAGNIPSDGYFFLERTDDDSVLEITADQIYTGSLSNTGEWLKLYDQDGKLIDEINASNSWPGGDNTTKQTLERSATNNWQTSAEPGGTPKAKNSPVNQDEPPPEEQPPTNEAPPAAVPEPITKVNKGDIIITEVFPNPGGVDIEQEFIEIKNLSRSPIDLTSFKITNQAKQTFIIPSLIMMPNSIVTFYRTQTNLALNNSAEKITLYSKSDSIIDRLEYKSPAPENESYQKNSEDKWQWGLPTPGKDSEFAATTLPVAIITGPKEARVGEIITFDGSDSFDSESRELKFFWQFGDGRTDYRILTRQIYLQPGNYEVSLNVAATSGASSTESWKIKIIGEENLQSTTTPTSLNPAGSTTTPEIIPEEEIPFIFISEFLPNPEGADETEFIEIFSNHDKPVNLAGWQLDDAEGGSKPYTIPEVIIKPGQYLAFFRTDTKIALNNSTDSVRLIAPDGTLVDYADYEKTQEGTSFVLDEQFNWQQSTTPTPGEINVLDEIEEEPAESEAEKPEPKVLGVEIKEESVENNQPKNKNKYIVSGISAVVILGIGTILKMKKKNIS